MPLSLYIDHHIHGAITDGLRRRGVDVLTAAEDGANQLPDPALLDRAAALGRLLFSQDDDLLNEAARRQRNGEPFSGVIYAHQLGISVGQCVEELALLAQACSFEELAGSVVFLPL